MSGVVLNLRLAGTLMIILALAHLPIGRYFLWREESHRLSAFNRQAFLVHAFFIALGVALVGILVVFWPAALVTPSPLGLPVTAGLSIFWSIRLYCQLFVFERALWRGKSFETAMHVLFTAFWIYLIVTFGWCARLQLGSLRN